MQHDERYLFYSEAGAELTASALKQAGLYPNRNGYLYILHAVDLLIKYGKMDLKKLYEKVAFTYGVSAKRIASSVNYIAKSFCADHTDRLFKQMGVLFHRELTAKELIFLLYDLVITNLIKRYEYNLRARTRYQSDN